MRLLPTITVCQVSRRAAPAPLKIVGSGLRRCTSPPSPPPRTGPARRRAAFSLEAGHSVGDDSTYSAEQYFQRVRHVETICERRRLDKVLPISSARSSSTISWKQQRSPPDGAAVARGHRRLPPAASGDESPSAAPSTSRRRWQSRWHRDRRARHTSARVQRADSVADRGARPWRALAAGEQAR